MSNKPIGVSLLNDTRKVQEYFDSITKEEQTLVSLNDIKINKTQKTKKHNG